jgi:hypothetical protein
MRDPLHVHFRCEVPVTDRIMTPVSLGPILTLGAGIVIGLLIAWGVFGRSSLESPNTPVVPAPTPNQTELQAVASTTNIEFNQDYLVVTFAPAGQSFSGGTMVGPFSVWVMDEFGRLVSAVGNQTLGQGLLGSVTCQVQKGHPINRGTGWVQYPRLYSFSWPLKNSIRAGNFSPARSMAHSDLFSE